ncbi:ABC transporter protein [Halorhabdus tiamatea SARL4B]|uniref:ABC transporter protein n=1 Tax=Halorhabdus tiamatea SARL4B TaxID=1033806 RepID=U2FDS8_9EURY|nr:ABC transporter ATP-binding protein [Halorhabdus tiamatea]ERJ06464.1 ABC transporter protein [Halorhabdus tiamatea SARL4B]
MSAIAIEEVRRTYGDTVALDSVSLSVDAGEIFGLVGPNGAGKTTLARAITGTTDYEGTVSLFGEDPRAIDRSRLGSLPQSFSPHERLTARELLEYYAGLYDDALAPGRVLRDVGLVESADTYYENLSGGQQRRVCVGSALVNDPDLLVLDEPTTGIDPAGRRQLWNLLEALAADGTTIFLTTHDMHEADRLADRVGLLADGSVVAVDTPTALIDAHGGESRLTIETPTPLAEADAPTLGYRTAITDGDLRVFDVAPTEIGNVVDALTESGIETESLSWSEPALEDVYLELTGTAVGRGGRRLDDETETGADNPSASATPTEGSS